jgi:acetyl esterase/lipase
MKKLLSMALTLLLSTAVTWSQNSATPPQTALINLQGQPLTASPNTVVTTGGLDRVHASPGFTPLLHLFRTAERPSRGTVLIFPGGGYHLLGLTSSTNAAQFINRAGYDSAVLEYTINQGREIPLAEAKTALNLLQAKGQELGLNTQSMLVAGFSAGGHLATRLIHELGNNQPFQKAVLVYPAYLNGTSGIAPESVPPSGTKIAVFVMIGDKDNPDWIAGAKAYGEAVTASGGSAQFQLLQNMRHGFVLNLLHPQPYWAPVLEFLKGP